MKVELVDYLGSDITVVNAARCSFNKQKDVFDASDEKLINYLAKHNHWTPFAHVQVSLRVEMPIFIARQYFKSQVGSVKNEVSRRYVDTPPEFWYPDNFRSRPEKSLKQGSGDNLEEELNESCLQAYETAINQCRLTYDYLLRSGVCPEQARAVLPQSMMTTVMDCGSLVYWARLYNQRSDFTHAQKDWEELVVGIDTIMTKLYPISWKALTKKG